MGLLTPILRPGHEPPVKKQKTILGKGIGLLPLQVLRGIL